MLRQVHLIAVVGTFLIGCAVLVVVGGSEVLAEASQHNKQKLSGTNGKDNLEGGDGDETIRGLGGPDFIEGGSGDDVIYGGPGDDTVLEVDNGEDVIYGGNGNDHLAVDDGHRDKLYCGEGNDHYQADPNDYVDSSCEPELASVEPTSASGCDVAPGCGQDYFSAGSGSPSASPFSGPQVLVDGGGPFVLLPAAALLLLGSGSILTYAILRRR
jgi:Ca2+-binding RTX toxin-like protein